MASAKSLILHHYDTSPFSEKIRLALRLKNLAWTSVTIPNIMPKPDLLALTGGYRRTPVLQIGADIFLRHVANVDRTGTPLSNPDPGLTRA